MMRLTISAVAVAVLIVVAISLPLSRSPSIALSPSLALSTAAMPPLEELHVMAGVNTLPVQEIEDQSLVYPTPTKR
jgi:hypothetical protein